MHLYSIERECVCVTSHIACECGCAYMYKCTFLDTTRFKAVITMNLLDLPSWACFCDSSTKMGDIIGSLVWGSQKRTILCRWGWVVTNGIRAIAQLKMGGACTSPWGSPAGTLGPKRRWLWRPTSLGNEDVLICINTPFLTQRILKLW
jgi:hypothetical protein